MSYATLMVQVTHLVDSPTRIGIAAALARRLNALLIGAAADDIVASGPNALSSPWLANGRERQAREFLAVLETQFEAESATAPRRSWRGGIGAAGPFLARAAAAADLLVVGRSVRGPPGHDLHVDPAQLTYQAGRPVLVIPPDCRTFTPEVVLVAWKGGRDCRRALADAVPLLIEARQVRVLGVGDETSEAAAGDAVGFLRRHGVSAEAGWRPAPVGGIGAGLLQAADEMDAGLIVAGAHGYSHLRDFVLGDVSGHLIASARVPCLLSH